MPAVAATLAASLTAAAAHAGVLRYCERRAELPAPAQDQLLRIAALVRSELDRSGAPAAIVSRSGLDLDRWHVRYSHAGVGVKAAEQSPWAVRQLYYACDERRPLLFDQGIAAFVLGSLPPPGADDAAHDAGYVSLVFVPPAAAAALASAAIDRARSLQLLGAAYSANAYPWDTAYQNCNQWVAELLATAWGGIGPGAERPREQAQRLLRDDGYEPASFDVGAPLASLALALVPWVHADDHPPADVQAGRWRVSTPASIEAWVRRTMPGSTRVELCHAGTRVVVHRGWDPVADGCVAGAGDEVTSVD